jgi:hypothetical protein
MPQYSKTTWVDGSAPAISAANLNKLEQGVFDSLRQDGSTTMSAQLVTIAGTAATPAIAPTGDSNTGIFFPAADTIAFGEGGTEAMRITSAGNVGIGTDSPSSKLTIRDSSPRVMLESNTNGNNIGYKFYALDSGGSAKQAGLYFQPNTSSNSYLSLSADDASDHLVVKATGNVGIGTQSPDAKLNVFATSSTTIPALRIASSGSLANNDVVRFQIDGLTNGFRMFQNASQNIIYSFETGNVGIGTVSPTYKLDVDGIIRAKNTLYIGRSSDSAVIGSVAEGSSNGLLIKAEAGGTDSTITFNTGANDRMRITSAGNVGIGNTPASWGSGYAALSVKNAGNSISSSGQNQLLFSSNAYDSSAGAWKYNNAGSYANLMEIGSNGYLFYQTTSTQGAGNSITWSEKMRLDTNGYLLIGYTNSNGAYPLQVNGQIFATSSTIATSDGRYKKDIVSLDGALDIVAALNPVQFNWKEHPVHKFNTEVPTIGFIAQEVAEVLKDKAYLTSVIKKSECTWETETGEIIEREVTRDIETQVEREVIEEVDGEEIARTITETVIEQVTETVSEPVKETHTEEFYGIAESNMIAILTKAIQELNAKVEALEAQLAK